MDSVAHPIDLPVDGSARYTATVVLLGQVIALQSTQIARERSRARPDHVAIDELERGRTAAVLTCRSLTSAEPDAMEAVRSEYSRVYLDLLADARAAARVRQPLFS